MFNVVELLYIQPIILIWMRNVCLLIILLKQKEI